MKKSLLLIPALAFTLCSNALGQNSAVTAKAKFISNVANDKLYQQICAQQATTSAISSTSDDAKYADVMISAADNAATAEKLRAMGIAVGTCTDDGMTVRVPVDKIDKLASIEGIRNMQISHQLFPLLDNARTACGVNSVHSGKLLTMPYTGEGTIVGIIDTGFQYDHSAFIDTDTGKSRISRIWEQRCDTVASLRPDGFSYGCEYAPGKATLSVRQYDIATSTHGTHVVGIAAGGDTRLNNPYYGVSPKSEIVLVSTKSTTTTVIDAVKYIFDYAESQHKPCVINISLGTNLGPHDGTSQADRMLDALQGEGRLIVGAVGNSAGSSTHIGKSFSIKDHSLNTALQFTSYSSTQIGAMEIWGSEGKKFKTTLSIYDKTTNRTLASFGPIDSSKPGEETFSYRGLADGATDSTLVTIYTVAGISPYNNKPNLAVTSVASIDKKRIFLCLNIEAVSGEVNMWNDGGYCTFSNAGHPDYTTGDDSYTASELGGSGKKVISVGAFTTKNQYSTLDGNEYSTRFEIGDICSFSSKGPTIDGRTKPEITAPGSIIISAYNRYYLGFSATKMVSSIAYNERLSYFGSMQGTSMASPFVAGTMSLWLQADPSLTPERAKKYLQESATNDAYTGNVRDSGSPQWGYGKINAYNGLKLCVESGVSEIDSPESDYAYSITDGTLQIMLSSDAANVVASVYDTMGRLIGQYSSSAVEALTPIEIADIPAGVAIVKLSTSTASRTFKVLSE